LGKQKNPGPGGVQFEIDREEAWKSVRAIENILSQLAYRQALTKQLAKHQKDFQMYATRNRALDPLTYVTLKGRVERSSVALECANALLGDPAWDPS